MPLRSVNFEVERKSEKNMIFWLKFSKSAQNPGASFRRFFFLVKCVYSTIDEKSISMNFDFF